MNNPSVVSKHEHPNWKRPAVTNNPLNIMGLFTQYIGCWEITWNHCINIALYKFTELPPYVKVVSQLVCAMQKINKGNHLTTLCFLAWVSVVQMSHLNLKKSLTHRFLLLSQLPIFGNEHTSKQFKPGTLELSHTIILPISSLYPPFQSSVERVLSGGQTISALRWEMQHDKFVLVSLLTKLGDVWRLLQFGKT